MSDKKMANTLFIHATNVHQGGGERLLNLLLTAVDPNVQTVLNVDERLILPDVLPKGLVVRRIKKSIWARIGADYALYCQADMNDRVLCFGNLPPLLRVKAFTTVFVQNRYLVDDISLSGLKLWPRLRISLERFWLRLSIFHADQYVVQTSSMQRLLNRILKDSIPIVIAPFAEIDKANAVKRVFKTAGSSPQFIYVASGDEHKNHRRLLEAWCMLATDGIRPGLLLTIDKATYHELDAWIRERISLYGLMIKNIGNVDSCTVNDFYRQSDALIYPSMLESFGLPLIEASALGLEIVAAELDYVRDVARPAQTFDPNSALSIARAVKRYCGYGDPEIQLISATEFLNLTTNKLR